MYRGFVAVVVSGIVLANCSDSARKSDLSETLTFSPEETAAVFVRQLDAIGSELKKDFQLLEKDFARVDEKTSKPMISLRQLEQMAERHQGYFQQLSELLARPDIEELIAAKYETGPNQEAMDNVIFDYAADKGYSIARRLVTAASKSAKQASQYMRGLFAINAARGWVSMSVVGIFGTFYLDLVTESLVLAADNTKMIHRSALFEAVGEKIIENKEVDIRTPRMGVVQGYDEFNRHLASWFTYPEQRKLLRLLSLSEDIPPVATWKSWSMSWNIENLNPGVEEKIESYLDKHAEAIFISIDELRMERGVEAFTMFPVLNDHWSGRLGVSRQWRLPYLLSELDKFIEDITSLRNIVVQGAIDADA